VNDGVCDYELCCDGSDEWDSVGGVKCEDRCAKVGKEWRKADEARQKSLNAANQRRRELAVEATRLKKEVEDRIKTLHTQIQADEIKVTNMEKSLQEIEKREKGKVFKGTGKGGKLTVLSSLAKDRIQELINNLGRVKHERDTARERIQELEAILTTFKEEYNPNFNDEGVKRAVKAWEDYAAQDRPGPDEAGDRDVEDILNPESESAINWSEYEDTEESDVELCKSHFNPPPITRNNRNSGTNHRLRSIQIRRIPSRTSPKLDRRKTPLSARHAY
jgi:protein kinase C substrate 80K-H